MQADCSSRQARAAYDNKCLGKSFGIITSGSEADSVERVDVCFD